MKIYLPQLKNPQKIALKLALIRRRLSKIFQALPRPISAFDQKRPVFNHLSLFLAEKKDKKDYGYKPTAIFFKFITIPARLLKDGSLFSRVKPVVFPQIRGEYYPSPAAYAVSQNPTVLNFSFLKTLLENTSQNRSKYINWFINYRKNGVNRLKNLAEIHQRYLRQYAEKKLLRNGFTEKSKDQNESNYNHRADKFGLCNQLINRIESHFNLSRTIDRYKYIIQREILFVNSNRLVARGIARKYPAAILTKNPEITLKNGVEVFTAINQIYHNP